jgi:hypothetical protein
MFDINDHHKMLVEHLSTERKKELCEQLGLAPKLPAIYNHIADDKIYTTSDVATFLSYTPYHVRRLCKNGRITAVQFDPRGKYLIFGEHVKKFIAENLYRMTIQQRLKKQ